MRFPEYDAPQVEQNRSSPGQHCRPQDQKYAVMMYHTTSKSLPAHPHLYLVVCSIDMTILHAKDKLGTEAMISR